MRSRSRWGFVPEPNTALLASLGLVGLPSRRR
ncbi:MAG: PEP-CTERM sorting domain-containing protein [Myxococcota bacterium]